MPLTMQRTHGQTYSYPYSSVGSGRYSSHHASSSAFSASANPNEDWTKISDLAERRRIQNRIAQRNYRKKLKRRLEDLERRAASSSASPEQSHEELEPSNSDTSEDLRSSRTLSASSASTNKTRTMSPEVVNADSYSSPEERGALFSQQCTRQLSASPPPFFSYGSYPLPEQSSSYMPYPQHTAYHTLPVPYGEYTYGNQYIPPIPSPLPTLLPSTTSMKKDSVFAEDDMMSPFSMNYASMAGIDISATHTFSDSSSAQTPPLTHSTTSFEHSRENSPAHSLSAFPITPASMPASPGHI